MIPIFINIVVGGVGRGRFVRICEYFSEILGFFHACPNKFVYDCSIPKTRGTTYFSSLPVVHRTENNTTSMITLASLTVCL